ncbi:FkbM family methyltransferase [Spirulina subsalsa]|uniref:FkbM family methyltransferase n=1 Tax=Spirulina subsalsa TaxID=54311 RepID=UPI00031D9CCA|nr:FkbM family methyltransferase [Spirulina subsalsa]
MSSSELDRIIPPEIKHDEFYDLIVQLAQNEPLQTVLEIGSSSGGGSTEAFVRGLANNPHHPRLFCLEISKPRFQQLKTTYQNSPFVHCYNLSSVHLNQFPTPNEVEEFYTQYRTGLNAYPLPTVLNWLQQDLDYVQQWGGTENGIEYIKREQQLEQFDLVLIDGSEFAGEAELQAVYGSTFILLDDINTYKNYKNYYRLAKDWQYELIAENRQIRNGYAIFKRNTSPYKKQDILAQLALNPEQKEQKLVENLVPKGGTVFDVGANVGDYSILLSQLVGYFGRVYAFEPTSSIFMQLQTRLTEYQLNNITLTQKAVYAENTTLEFNEFPDDYSAWNSLGKPVMSDPHGNYEIVPIVKTEQVEAITLDTFCQENNIETIDFLKVDVEGAESYVFQGAEQLLAQKKARFIQFEISQKMLEGLNKTAQETFNLLAAQGYECHEITPEGEIGELVHDSQAFYENYIAFRALPVHFFTIVLNGEPFIRYHIEILQQLPFPWHWHIVEGVADLKHDTAWSVKLGGQVTDAIHRDGLSQDGTSDYLDQLVAQYPDNITLYRQPKGTFWEGKREMVNAPLKNIQEECLLWQIDVDELWTVEQIKQTRNLFISHPEKTAAYYWCWYFVGEDLIVTTRNCYSQNPQQDWLRTWRYKPGYFWAAHEPPVLVEPLADGKFKNVAAVNPFRHEETSQKGLIFQHFAYVLPEQLQFKEQYYGYTQALNYWQQLQKAEQFPVLLREYFPWVGDDTMVDHSIPLGIEPIMRKDGTGAWNFNLNALPLSPPQLSPPKPIIVIDGVFFQRYQTGIARVWRSLLEEWATQEFGRHLIVIDRAGSAPKIAGIQYQTLPEHNYNDLAGDQVQLQELCDRNQADLFISTYYSFPTSTPSVFMAYDMIPEVLGANFNNPMWQEKHAAIQRASGFLAISHNTAQDLQKLFPHVSSVTVAHCGVKAPFIPPTASEIEQFRLKYGIQKPYFLLSAPGTGYKNAPLFFKAFAQLCSRQGFELVCTGTYGILEDKLRNLVPGTVIHLLTLTDEELRLAYGGAVALVYPSKYEGFGLPILEAMACGCPVITCANASIPEVAGDAAIYINEYDVEGMSNALCEVQKPLIRQGLIAQGLKQAQSFPWAKMATTVQEKLLLATLDFLQLKAINLIIFPDWTQEEETIAENLRHALYTLAQHPQPEAVTLLIDHTGVSAENGNLILSFVVMNVLMEEEITVSEETAISWLGELSPLQWQVLLPRLTGRIALAQENEAKMQAVGADVLRVYSVDPS